MQQNDTPQAYVTKDLSTIRELLHPSRVPGLGVSLAEAVVEAGGQTAEHYHGSFDEIYYGLEGHGTLYINGTPQAFGPHSYVLLPKNARHYLKASTRLRLLCVCCPGYTHEETVLVGA